MFNILRESSLCCLCERNLSYLFKLKNIKTVLKEQNVRDLWISDWCSICKGTQTIQHHIIGNSFAAPLRHTHHFDCHVIYITIRGNWKMHNIGKLLCDLLPCL